MGLHQKITDRITSEPCDCGADDDHGAEATQETAPDAVFNPDGLFTSRGLFDVDWTDGTEATE